MTTEQFVSSQEAKKKFDEIDGQYSARNDLAALQARTNELSIDYNLIISGKHQAQTTKPKITIPASTLVKGKIETGKEDDSGCFSFFKKCLEPIIAQTPPSSSNAAEYGSFSPRKS